MITVALGVLKDYGDAARADRYLIAYPDDDPAGPDKSVASGMMTHGQLNAGTPVLVIALPDIERDTILRVMQAVRVGLVDADAIL